MVYKLDPEKIAFLLFRIGSPMETVSAICGKVHLNPSPKTCPPKKRKKKRKERKET